MTTKIVVGVCVLAAAFALSCGFAKAEIVTTEVGPVELRGLYGPSDGPFGTAEFRFKHPGWIRGFSVQVLDAGRRLAEGKGIFCHATIKDKRFSPIRGGVFSEPAHLTVAEGQTDIKFPEGYGIPIDSTTPYYLMGQLQSADVGNNGEYSLLYQFDVAWKGAGSQLKTLYGIAVGVDDLNWKVRPGRNQFQHEFKMPFSSTVHYLAFHLHPYTIEISIIDAQTGRPLYKAPVKNGKGGWPQNIPFYSDVLGIPLAKGRRYIYRTLYDNPLKSTLSTMSFVRLYVHPSDALQVVPPQ